MCFVSVGSAVVALGPGELRYWPTPAHMAADWSVVVLTGGKWAEWDKTGPTVDADLGNVVR